MVACWHHVSDLQYDRVVFFKRKRWFRGNRGLLGQGRLGGRGEVTNSNEGMGERVGGKYPAFFLKLFPSPPGDREFKCT